MATGKECSGAEQSRIVYVFYQLLTSESAKQLRNKPGGRGSMAHIQAHDLVCHRGFGMQVHHI